MVTVIFNLNWFVQQVADIIDMNIVVQIEGSGTKNDRGYMALASCPKA